MRRRGTAGWRDEVRGGGAYDWAVSERDPLKPVYAIFGEDRPKVERTVARLIKRAVEDGCLETERLTAQEHPPDVVAASAQTLSFS